MNQETNSFCGIPGLFYHFLGCLGRGRKHDDHEVTVSGKQGKYVEMQHLGSLGDKSGLSTSCSGVTGRQGGPLERLHLDFLQGNPGLPNPSNHCFINALLQCLFSLEGLKFRLEKVRGENYAADRLYKLFCAIESKDINRKNNLNDVKNELFDSIVRAMKEIRIIQEEGGDSRIFFQALCMSIVGKKSIKEDPVFSLFCNGDLVKKVTCSKCQTSREFIEDPLMLNVQEDLYYSDKLAENFFQSDTELRQCKFCPEKAEHSKEISLTAFPEILALRIIEIPFEKLHGKKACCSTKMDLTLKDKQGKEVRYEFVSGVYNTKRGYDGFHSVAYVRNKEGRMLCYNDEKVCEQEIRGYPKLLFYKKIE